VTLCVALLTSILKINDFKSDHDLRKKFMQQEGLKHLFGVCVTEDHAKSNPDELKKKMKPS
jgi:hypothetical protein